MCIVASWEISSAHGGGSVAVMMMIRAEIFFPQQKRKVVGLFFAVATCDQSRKVMDVR